MQALISEKAFILGRMERAQNSLRRFETKRSGIFIEARPFSVMSLARLLQDIARAKLAEIRLLSFLAVIEEKLRRKKPMLEGRITLGSAPESAQRPRHHLGAQEAFLLTFGLLRLQR